MKNNLEWWDYEAQKAVALPPVGSTVFVTGNGELTKVIVIGHDDGCAVLRLPDDSSRERFYKAVAMVYLRPLDYEAHKAEGEKKRVVDAAYNAIAKPNGIGVDAAIAELYDAGFLRMPAE
jgi:hypothetical protein